MAMALQTTCTKNAVAEAHEIAHGMGWKLQLTHSPPVGPPHMPVITATALLSGEGLPAGGLTTDAASHSTRTARAQAARQLLDHPDVLLALQKNQKLLERRLTSSIGPVLDQGPNTQAEEPEPRPKDAQDYKGLLSNALIRAADIARKLPGFKKEDFMATYTHQISGQCHAPTFVVSVEVQLPDSTHTAMGMASKKRLAEQMAASSVLQVPEVRGFLVSTIKHKRCATALNGVGASPGGGGRPSASSGSRCASAPGSDQNNESHGAEVQAGRPQVVEAPPSAMDVLKALEMLEDEELHQQQQQADAGAAQPLGVPSAVATEEPATARPANGGVLLLLD